MAAKSKRVLSKTIWDETLIFWMAGLIEGEGCFHKNKTHRGGYNYPRMRLSMTDEDVVRRAYELSGIGTLSGPQKSPARKEHWKPNWVWAVSRKEEVYRLLLAVYPLMGQRRQQQIRESI